MKKANSRIFSPRRGWGSLPRTSARKSLAVLSLLPLLAWALPIRAATVAEWKFDGKEALGVDQIVALDAFSPRASGESVLMAETAFSPEDTGIGEKWAPFLQKGFLDVHEGAGKTSRNKHGLVTNNPEGDKLYPAGKASYAAYVGFSGLGANEKGGTLYLVVSPRGWSSGSYSLFGTGHYGGQVILAVEKGELRFFVGQGGSGTKKTNAILTQEWQPDAWYFVAISWSGGQEPVLYVRKMEAGGAEASPASVVGTTAGPAPDLTEQPKYDPLVIGARWVNTGGDDTLFTADGANARFAYARVDNTYSSKEAMDTVFQSLAAP